MALYADSEITIRIAWYVGITSVAACVVLTVYAFLLRALDHAKNKRAAKFLTEWEGLIAESLDGLPENLPPVKSRDAISFLRLWNHLQESLRAESNEKLNLLARAADIDVVAMDFLDRGSMDERLLAINTLGWLRHSTNWKKLYAIAESDDPVYSLVAAKALMRIEPQRGLRNIMPLMARRADWSAATVASILREAGAALISAPLARATLAADSPEHKARLIRFLELAHTEIAIPTIRKIMETASEMEVITACLRIFCDTEDLEMVRELMNDLRWQIRLRAAECLGRIGTADDEERLIRAAGDAEWWVRYRAAQAFANLPSMTLERLSVIAEQHTVEQARQIICQVIAEKRVAVES